jgi:hypothetical protein
MTVVIVVVTTITTTTTTTTYSVHSLQKSEFSRQHNLALPLSSSSIYSFPYGHSVAAYVLVLFYSPFYLSFNNVV